MLIRSISCGVGPGRSDRTVSLDLFFGIHSADPTRQIWTILVAGEVAGLLQLKQTHIAGGAAMGIALGSTWIGQGYGREVLGVFLNAFFGPWAFQTMQLEVAIANRRARHLYDAFEFRETKRFWRDAGPDFDLRFLDEPGYAEVRPYFRWANTGVYQLCAEMQLAASNP